jgi:hypothetical protein
MSNITRNEVALIAESAKTRHAEEIRRGLRTWVEQMRKIPPEVASEKRTKREKFQTTDGADQTGEERTRYI